MIKPTCDACGKEMMDFGAIYLSPPDREGRVDKKHICLGCVPRFSVLFKNAGMS